VVVLDFWYRGCGWCIKAMPQLNALAGQFEGRPVAVLGMNTDRDEADAKFVSDAMGLKYETLRALGIPEKYGVQGFPTLVVIDPERKVRDMHPCGVGRLVCRHAALSEYHPVTPRFHATAFGP
jgi:thiol-disulfide isomerase/thioredoxin